MCAKDFVGRMDWQIQRGVEAQIGGKTSLAKPEISSSLSLLCFKANSSGPYGMSGISAVIFESFSPISLCGTQGVQVAFEVVCDALMLSMLRRMPHVHSFSHVSQLPPNPGAPRNRTESINKLPGG